VKAEKRAPGSSRENFSDWSVSLVSKKPLRKVWSVTGSWPWPPKTTVRWNPKLEVLRGLEGEHLGVDPVVVGRGVAFEAAVEEVVADGAEQAREVLDAEGFDAVDAEGVDVLGVVGPGHGAAHGGAEPRVGLAAGDFVAEDVVGEGGFDDAEGILRDDGAGGDGGLRIVGGCEGDGVEGRELG